MCTQFATVYPSKNAKNDTVYELCTAVYTVQKGRKPAFSVYLKRFTYQKRLPNCELCTVYAASDCTQFVSS